MGATVTTGKLAAAFKAASGKIMYVLFEETYEKNCHPHTPRWSCCSIGTIERVMRWIFLGASECETGMLQSRNGNITPEGYVAAWLQQLANPVELADRTIELKRGDVMYSPIPNEVFARAAKRLSENGRQDIADALSAGQCFPLSLYSDAELIATLYGDFMMGPWHIIHHAPIHGTRRADLGYAPAPAKSFEVVVPSFLKMDKDHLLVQRTDGTWYYGGREYTAVASHVCRLWESEVREPGSYRKRIKAYREAIKAAPDMPAGTKVVVDQTVVLEGKYARDVVDKLPDQFPVSKTATGYEIAVINEGNRLWYLTQLPEACTSWVTPTQVGNANREQLSLLAAA